MCITNLLVFIIWMPSLNVKTLKISAQIIWFLSHIIKSISTHQQIGRLVWLNRRAIHFNRYKYYANISLITKRQIFVGGLFIMYMYLQYNSVCFYFLFWLPIFSFHLVWLSLSHTPKVSEVSKITLLLT